MDYETLLKEYHNKIGEIFLAEGQSPFRICKQIWKLYGEMSWKLASLPTTGAVDLGDASALEVGQRPEVLSAGQGESHPAPNH